MEYPQCDNLVRFPKSSHKNYYENVFLSSCSSTFHCWKCCNVIDVSLFLSNIVLYFSSSCLTVTSTYICTYYCNITTCYSTLLLVL